MSKPLRVLVVGFYDRYNAGDEQYKTTIKEMLTGPGVADVSFVCSDDLETVPSDTDVLVCGGGEIVNEYFMSKIADVTRSFYGKMYALSVGIGYASEAHHLHMFDHVFPRSSGDCAIAIAEVGSENVTRIPDAGFGFPKGTRATRAPSSVLRVAVMLANPVVRQAPAIADHVLAALCGLMGERRRRVAVDFVSFNSDPENETESDLAMNAELCDRAWRLGLDARMSTRVTASGIVGSLIAGYDLGVCGRYHAAVFCAATRTPFVVIGGTPKLDKLTRDLGCQSYVWTADCGANLTDVVTRRINDVAWTPEPPDFVPAASEVYDVIVRDRVAKTVRRTTTRIVGMGSLEASRQRCRDANVEEVRDHDPDLAAKLACYEITRSAATPFEWGMSRQMADGTFDLDAATEYVWSEQKDAWKRDVSLAAGLNVDPRRVMVNVDPWIHSDYAAYHRAGWSEAVAALLNLDLGSFGKSDGKAVTVDTYVDRTFHWKRDLLSLAGVLPYKGPWIGFVHHTFDAAHGGTHNCATMFQDASFLASLSHCRALIALSRDLRQKLEVALSTAGFPNVPVHHVRHPMERVPGREFDMTKFIENPDKRVVQIGAWLRDPYAIYDLPVQPDWRNPMGVRKAVLKGLEMESYFRPNDLFDRLRDLFSDVGADPHKHRDRPSRDCPSRDDDHPSRDDDHPSRDCPSRDDDHPSRDDDHPSRDCPSRDDDHPSRDRPIHNKWCAAALDALEAKDASVQVLERLTNEGYDSLLERNLVFLRLTDCSAVNTVLECLVRDTPLFVNRHPALAEVLGDAYPGFYENLVEASLMVTDLNKVLEIHEYLKRRDKAPYTFEAFVNRFQDVVMHPDQADQADPQLTDDMLRELNVDPLLFAYVRHTWAQVDRFLKRRFYPM